MKRNQCSLSSYFLPVALLILTSGCVTTPKGGTTAVDPDSTFKTYAQVDYFDKVKNAHQSGTVDFIWSEKEQMRLELSGPFGYPVLSAVLDRTKVYAANHLQKKYYDSDIKHLGNIPNFNFDLGYKEFLAMLNDTKFEHKNWNCTLDKNQKLESCVRAQDGMRIVWGDRNLKGGKTVLIKNENTDIRLSFLSPPTKVQAKLEFFVLNMPNGYKKYQLQ